MVKPKPYTFNNLFFDLLMKYLYLESYGFLYDYKFISNYYYFLLILFLKNIIGM